jgi:type III secretion protein R
VNALWITAAVAFQDPQDSGALDPAQMTTLVVVLVSLALAPFLLSMITAFAKLVIVGGLLRQALGTQQTPPTSVLTGIALILTLHIMAPVAANGYQRYQQRMTDAANEGQQIQVGLGAGREVVGEFLDRHSSDANRQLFRDLRTRLGGTDAIATAGGDAARSTIEPWLDLFTINAPAFLLSELTEAFQIGFLLLVPFLVIELIVSNILMAMGMMMMNPQVITLPLKLLLFVLVDGWRLILEGLVQGYVT